MVDAYKCGLRRFSSISCREKEGVDICRLIGFEATHVVDPTLLDIDFDKVKFLRESEKSELVCYF